MWNKLIITLLLFFSLTLTPALGYNLEEQVNINVYEKINPAIVSIDAQLGDGFSSGTGCFIDSSGVILTSSHVVQDSKEIEITTHKGEVFKAKIISKLGKDNDLSLLKINSKSKLSTIKLGTSQNIKVGQRVLAIGNPFGFNGTLTQGIISRIDYTKNKLQTDAAINPGCSGGPLLNTSGEVIGISQSIFNPDNNISNIGIGFAIPVDTVREFLAQNKF